MSEKKAIFVTRFAPSVKESDIQQVLDSLKLIYLSCVRLKTKFELYNSFRVEVLESDFVKVNDPDVWPVGILIAPFYGKLTDVSKFDTNKEEELMEDGTSKTMP